ncbi:ATPase, AAA family, partial [Teladorsagia circumcincta]
LRVLLRYQYQEHGAMPLFPSIVPLTDMRIRSALRDLLAEPAQVIVLFSCDSDQRSGIMLFGPPGCGKTLIAKGLFFHFFKNPGAELDPYVKDHSSSILVRLVKQVFERARQASPCVVFFDEIDSLAPNRGRNGDAGGVMDRIVSQLIAELDSLHDSPHIKVFVMAATNRADLIDPSLMTPGRFDKVIEVAPGADVESKTKILKAVSRNLKLADDVDLRNVVRYLITIYRIPSTYATAEQCEGQWSGAELYSLMSTAAMESMREQIALIEDGMISESDVDGIVSATHIQAAIDKKRTEHQEGIRRKA